MTYISQHLYTSKRPCFFSHKYKQRIFHRKEAKLYVMLTDPWQFQAGFRDGAAAGRDAVFQKGFDTGYAEGYQAALSLGYLKGAMR
jgi:flagellar biosynthesis/type III secretory pathway protein FliH